MDANELAELAEEHLNKRDFKRCLECSSRSLQIDPYCALASKLMGFLYYNGQGVPRDSQRALTFYEAAHKNGNPCAAKFLAHVLMEIGQLTRARSMLEYICKSRKAACCGRHHFAHFLLGQMEYDEGNATLAEALWKKAAGKGINEAAVALARLYFNRGDLQQALKLMQGAQSKETADTKHKQNNEDSDTDLIDDVNDEEYKYLEQLLEISSALPSKKLKAGVLIAGLANMGESAGAERRDSKLPVGSMQLCSNCGFCTAKPLRCSACKKVIYCSQTCQKQAWECHKYMCRN